MSDLVQYINDQREFFEPVISHKDITWEVEKQFAIQAITKSDYIAQVAMKNKASLQNALINVAAIGISLNPALKHAYLIPRKGEICLDIGYMGLLHLAQSSGVILWGQSKLVYENDNYVNKGIDKSPSHEFKAFGDRGKIIGCYCTVKTIDGDFLTEEMSIDDVYKIRGRSEGYKAYLKDNRKNSIWVTDEGEMIRKTGVKRAYKYWPKCERLGTAIKMLNENGEGIEKNITPNYITAEQIDTLLPLLCDEKGIYTEKGSKICRAHRFNNLDEVTVDQYDDVLEMAQ